MNFVILNICDEPEPNKFLIKTDLTAAGLKEKIYEIIKEFDDDEDEDTCFLSLDDVLLKLHELNYIEYFSDTEIYYIDL